MQRPTRFQHFGEAGRRVRAGHRGYTLSRAARLLWSAVTLDGAAQQVYLLVAAGIHGEVHEPALNLRPFVPALTRQPVGVLLEGLMEDAHHDQPVVAARSDLGELLEKVDVGAVVGGRLQELSHLVDEDDQTAAGPWMAGRCLPESVEDPLFTPPSWQRVSGESRMPRGPRQPPARDAPGGRRQAECANPTCAAARRSRRLSRCHRPGSVLQIA